jgi:hypothetical protein
MSLAAFLAMGGVSAGGCGVGDQLCPDDTLASDLTDDCPYGPPGGPQKKKQVRECPKVEFDDSDCAGVSFTTDIFPLFTDPQRAGKCTSSGCHGSTADAAKANGLHFSSDITPDALYQTLADHKNPQGDPYWGDHEELAWAQCNLLAQPGGGSPMPKVAGFTKPEDQDIVTKWITCGMVFAGGEGGGGAGGGASSSSSSSSSASTGAG